MVAYYSTLGDDTQYWNVLWVDHAVEDAMEKFFWRLGSGNYNGGRGTSNEH